MARGRKGIRSSGMRIDLLQLSKCTSSSELCDCRAMAVNQQIRQRKATVASNLPEDVEPIDEDEQASIVTSLEGEQVITIEFKY